MGLYPCKGGNFYYTTDVTKITRQGQLDISYRIF